MKFLTLIFSFLFALTLKVNSQTKSTIDSLSKGYQICLDSSMDMKDCSLKYYRKMDSMLNCIYDKLRKQLTSTEQTALKTDQKNWLRVRDKYFAVQDRIFYNRMKSGEWGIDMRMIPIDRKAKFVEKRVYVLLNKIKKRK